MKPWIPLALHQIWRRGVPNLDDLVDCFREVRTEDRMPVPLDEIYRELIGEGLIVFRHWHGPFAQLTEKGLDIVCAAEEPKWREKLKGVVYIPGPLKPQTKRVYDLQSRGLPLSKVAEAVGCSTSSVQQIAKQHKSMILRYEDYNREVQRFEAGEVHFKELRIEVFGEIGVRLANILCFNDIRTVPQLLNATPSYLSKKKNFGPKTMEEVNAVLERYGTRLESIGVDYRWYL